MNGCKRGHHATGKPKRAGGGGCGAQTPNTDLKMKTASVDQEGCFLRTKGLGPQEDTILLNTHAPSNRTPKPMKQKRRAIKGEMGGSTGTAGGIGAPLSITGRTSRQRVTKETEDLDTGNQPDPTARPRPSPRSRCIFLSRVRGTFSGTDPILLRL